MFVDSTQLIGVIYTNVLVLIRHNTSTNDSTHTTTLTTPRKVVLAAPNLFQTPNLRALKQSGAQPPLIVPFEHELFNFQAFSKGPELYTPVLSGNDDLYSTMIPAMATVTTTSTEVRQIAVDSSNKPADMGLYSTQDSAQGFQKGNSVSIPIVSRNANEEPKAGVEAC